MEYTEVRINRAFSDYQAELLIAKLTETGYEGFMEEEGCLIAYIPSSRYSLENLTSAIAPFLQIPDSKFQIPDSRFQINVIPDQNWNALWESNFEPVVIAGQVYVRAPFHPERPDIPMEIMIEPKMSFGTAHHETTSMVMELMLSTDLEGKSVLDMGCGTAILAILAAKRGAARLVAIDNDEWAYRNSIENIVVNRTPEIEVIMGDASVIPEGTFDVILANINRNILLKDIPDYIPHLHTGSLLFLSGFYKADMDKLKFLCAGLSLSFKRYICRNEWVAMEFIR